MKIHIFRLTPGKDLRESIEEYAKKHNIKAGVILTCVGSLQKAVVRMADENITKEYNEKFEIVSLVGTLSTTDCHLHISIADKNGNVYGGHLKRGSIVYTTAEIAIGEVEKTTFSYEPDEQTGFSELVVKRELDQASF